MDDRFNHLLPSVDDVGGGGGGGGGGDDGARVAARAAVPLIQSEGLWSVITIFACIPSTLSSVYKERALGEVDLDVVYLNGWVSVFQILLCVPMAVPSASAQQIPILDLPANTLEGWRCYMGVDTVTKHNPVPGKPLDHCESAPLYVTLYIVFNLAYNVLVILVLKYSSAMMLAMLSTILVPMSNVAFSLRFIPGHQPLRPSDLMGLLIIMLGLVMYRFYESVGEGARWLCGVLRELGRGDLKGAKDAVRFPAIRRKDSLAARVARRAISFVGLNQAESLMAGPLLDARVRHARGASLVRSPAQIRGSYLLALGVHGGASARDVAPPVPVQPSGGAGRKATAGRSPPLASPGELRRLLESSPPVSGGAVERDRRPRAASGSNSTGSVSQSWR